MMKKNKLYILTIYLIQFVFMYSCSNRDPYREEIDIFMNTELRDLAKAMKKDNLKEFIDLVNSKKYNLNFQDVVFGNTLIHICIYNNKYEFLEVLLKNKANPDIYDNLGMYPIVLLGKSKIIWKEPCNQDEIVFKYIKLFEKYDADLNLFNLKIDKKHSNQNSLLINLCLRYTLDTFNEELFNFVIKKGAKIDGLNNEINPLMTCYRLNNFKAMYYLLEKGANYKLVNTVLIGSDKKYNFNELIKNIYFKLDSKEYTLKKKVIDFLISKGEIYYELPIEPYFLEKIKKDYPNNWEEVSKVY